MQLLAYYVCLKTVPMRIKFRYMLNPLNAGVLYIIKIALLHQWAQFAYTITISRETETLNELFESLERRFPI